MLRHNNYKHNNNELKECLYKLQVMGNTIELIGVKIFFNARF